MADQASLRELESPPRRVPWPYGINLQLVPESKARLCNPRSSREDSPAANFRNSPLANFPRSLLVQLEVRELQSRMTQGGFGQPNRETAARIWFVRYLGKPFFKFSIHTIGRFLHSQLL